jgi:hypothetical protein
MIKASVGVVILLSFGPSVDYSVGCASLLPPAAQVKIEPMMRHGWRIVTFNDLPADDQALWKQYHVGKCPGVSEGRFRDAGKTSYAVALLKGHSPGKYIEQLRLIMPVSNSLSLISVVTPTQVSTPFVVWTVPPGRSTGMGGEPVVNLRTDSFVYEKMEASATQYYFRDGQLHTLHTAN